MKQNTKKRLSYSFFFICLLALIAYFFLGENLFSKKGNEENYISFCESVENGNIESVTIKTDKLEYKKKNVDELFYTENPESPLLKEFLLRYDVSIDIEKDVSEIISLIFDALFYLIFFVAIFFVFRKFISPNTFKVVHKTGKTFSDVVGMESLKHDMKQVMQIMQNPTEYAKKGLRMPKGILLEGAPGNGKTLFAKALAGEAKVNFIPAKATDFESMFMAISP